MNTLPELRKFLVDEGMLDQPLPKIIQPFIEALANSEIDIPLQAKVLVITTWLHIFATQFKTKVNYRNSDSPLTSIGFLFSPSGSGKDLTYNGVKRLFSKAMDKIDNIIFENYLALKQVDKELRAPALEMGFSTSEGMLANIAVTHQMTMGEPFIYSGEFIAEYKANPNTDTLLRDIIEISGTGEKQAKQLKGYSNQVGKIRGCGLTSLFASDISEIYQDPTLLTRLKAFFAKGLARRSSVVLIKSIKRKTISDIDFTKLTDTIIQTEAKVYELAQKLTDRIESIANDLIDNNKIGYVYKLSQDVRLKILQYSRFNEFDAADLETKTLDKNGIKLTQAMMRDKDFRAIKLAAAIAFLKKEETLSTESLLDAIAITEYLSQGMKEFEVELNKNTTDIFVDFCNQNGTGTTEYKAADLIKSGFLTQRTYSQAQLTNLATLANQIDSNSIYEVTKDMIIHNKLVLYQDFTMTYKPMEGMSKEARSRHTATGLTCIKFDTFDDVKRVLITDCCYAGFRFREGHRNKENLISKTSVLIFDIDDTVIDYKQFSHMISGINHHIALTSDPSNEYKYRIILELDREYDIPEKYYTKLMKQVKKEHLLDIPIDILGPAQIFYGYADRPIISAISEGNALCIKEMLSQLMAQKEAPTLTLKEKKAILEGDYLDNFAWAIASPEGQRSLNLIRVINTSFDYGATKEKTREIVLAVNNSFTTPFDEAELSRHIYPHLNKKYN